MLSPLLNLWQEVTLSPIEVALHSLEPSQPPLSGKDRQHRYGQAMCTVFSMFSELNLAIKDFLVASLSRLKNIWNWDNLTSQSLLYTVVRCATISFPESPRKWIILLIELVVARTLGCFEVHLIVMCWKDVRLWNCINLSWTTSTPEYSNCQTEKNHFEIRAEKMARAV